MKEEKTRGGGGGEKGEKKAEALVLTNVLCNIFASLSDNTCLFSYC